MSDMPYEFPRHLEHPLARTMITAADILQRVAPAYSGLIEELRKAAIEVSTAARPVKVAP